MTLTSYILTLCNHTGKSHVFSRFVLVVYVAIVSATGYTIKFAHCFNRVLTNTLFNKTILQTWLHFLPTADRKFRSNSFSIFRRLIVCSCDSCLAEGRPLGSGTA